MTIELTKKDAYFKEISFTTLARAVDNTRPILRLMRVLDGEITSCDGRRLHATKIDSGTLPNGLYEIIKSIKTKVIIELSTDYDFNNYSYVHGMIERYEHKDNVLNGICNIHISYEQLTSVDYSAIIGMAAIDSGKTTIDYDFLKDALMYSDKATICMVKPVIPTWPFYKIATNIGTSYIAPTRLGDHHDIIRPQQ